MKIVPCAWVQVLHRRGEIRVGVETRREFRFDTDLRDLRCKMLRAAGSTPQFVETGESDTTEEPSPKGAAVAPDPWSSLDEFQERLLHRVFCETLIVHHDVAEGRQGVGGVPIGRCKCGFASGSDSVHDLIQFRIVAHMPLNRLDYVNSAEKGP